MKKTKEEEEEERADRKRQAPKLGTGFADIPPKTRCFLIKSYSFRERKQMAQEDLFYRIQNIFEAITLANPAPWRSSTYAPTRRGGERIKE